MALLQTITLDIGCQVTDRSRRNEFTSHTGWSTGGNFTRQDLLLQPGGSDVSGASFQILPLPTTLLYIMTAASLVQLQATWTIDSANTTMLFTVNQLLIWSDMTNITALTLINNETAGSPPESVRILHA